MVEPYQTGDIVQDEYGDRAIVVSCHRVSDDEEYVIDAIDEDRNYVSYFESAVSFTGLHSDKLYEAIMEMRSSLKPCPFCGGRAKLFEECDGEIEIKRPKYNVQCTLCGITTLPTAKKTAIRKWNCRAIQRRSLNEQQDSDKS